MITKFRIYAAAALLLASCSYIGLPVTNQHPAWECNSSYAGPLGAAIASLLTADPSAIVAATSIAVNGCKAEASIAGGPPAQITTTTQTVSAVVSAPAAAPAAAPTATPSAASTATP
jgi:hypothetical protein